MSKFAILRIEKLKSHFEISQACKHNYRQIPVRHALNFKPVQELIGSRNAPQVAKDILDKHKVRKNAVYAFELMLSASPKYFREDEDELGTYDFSAYEAIELRALEFTKEYFGEDNVVSLVGHLDEATPHFHAIILPIDPKGKLNARHFTGGVEKLKAIQDAWALKCADLGLSRGLSADVPKKHVKVSEFHKLKDAAIAAEKTANFIIAQPKRTGGLAPL